MSLTKEAEKVALFDRLVVLAEGYLHWLETNVADHSSLQRVRDIVNEARELQK